MPLPQLSETERLERIAELLGSLPADNDVKGRTVALAYAYAINGRTDEYTRELLETAAKEPHQKKYVLGLSWLREESHA